DTREDRRGQAAAPFVGAEEAESLARAEGAGRDPARGELDRLLAEARGARGGATAPATTCGPLAFGADEADETQPGVVRRLQGPVQARQRQVLLPADDHRPVQPLPRCVRGAREHEGRYSAVGLR